MLRFLGLGKHQQNNIQLPSTIPGHLFRPSREEDGFVVVGETNAEQKTVDSSGFDSAGQFVDSIEQPPSYELCSGSYRDHYSPVMGAGVLSHVPSPVDQDASSSDQMQRIIQVQPCLENPYQYQITERDYLQRNDSRSSSPPRRTVSRTFSISSMKSSKTSNFEDSILNTWKDVPFQLSPKYFAPPIQEPDLIRITPINWSQFEYDFSMERAICQC